MVVLVKSGRGGVEPPDLSSPLQPQGSAVLHRHQERGGESKGRETNPKYKNVLWAGHFSVWYLFLQPYIYTQIAYKLTLAQIVILIL